MFLTDTHAHIHMSPLNEDTDAVIARAKEAGIGRIITVGVNTEDSKAAVELADKYDIVYAAVGIHPEDCKTYSEEAYNELKSLAGHKKVIAVGEIGLDFYRDYETPELQEKVFRRMIELAHEVNKPIIIHNRNASQECIKVLSSVFEEGHRVKGIFHCFDGSEEIIHWALANDFFISCAGQVTYKSAGNIRDALRLVPIERVFVETDCPYLAPVPKRGKTNEPSYVFHTAEFVANLYGVEQDKFRSCLEDNFHVLFGDQL